MHYESIDTLIEDVNRVALLPNPEELRIPCVRHVQAVYKKVGVDKINLFFEEAFQVKNRTVVLPPRVYKALDVLRPKQPGPYWGVHEGLYEYDHSFSLSKQRSAYRLDGNKIRFSEDWEEVVIIYQSLPINEEGELLIDSRIYDACVAYCRGQELLVKASNTKQERSTLNPTMVYINQAAQLINASRAELNEATWGQWRTFMLNQSKFVRSRYQHGWLT